MIALAASILSSRTREGCEVKTSVDANGVEHIELQVAGAAAPARLELEPTKGINWETGSYKQLRVKK